jgi:hypothetical protein
MAAGAVFLNNRLAGLLKKMIMDVRFSMRMPISKI